MVHTYMTPGIYTPLLAITDDDGSTGSAVAQIVITADEFNPGAKNRRPCPVDPMKSPSENR